MESYIILESCMSISWLQTAVNRKIEEGYIPSGNIYIKQTDSRLNPEYYYQAMVKKEIKW